MWHDFSEAWRACRTVEKMQHPSALCFLLQIDFSLRFMHLEGPFDVAQMHFLANMLPIMPGGIVSWFTPTAQVRLVTIALDKKL